MDRKQQFLVSVLGDDGASALAKAAERSKELGDVLVPRTIISWLGVAGRFDFEGEIPGVDNTYLSFERSEAGFSGEVSVGDELYKFEGKPLEHVAGAIAVALGIEINDFGDLGRDLDIHRLGKTIDCLVKSRVITEELKKQGGAAGGMAGGHAGGHTTPGAGGNAGSGTAAHGPAAPPIEPDAPTPPTPAAPKLPKPGKAKTPKLPKITGQTIKVTKSESARRCTVCGGAMFNNGAFKGCVCFQALSKSVTSTKLEDGSIRLDMGEDWDREAVVTLLESLGRR